MSAGGRRGRGRLLLCEGHTPTVQWVGGWRQTEHPLQPPRGQGSRDRCVLPPRFSLRGGWHQPRRRGVQKPAGPAFQGKRYPRDDPGCLWQGHKGQVMPPACCSGPLGQAAGFRTVFPPTRQAFCLSSSQSLCFHVSVVTWSSLSKAEQRGAAACRRSDAEVFRALPCDLCARSAVPSPS